MAKKILGWNARTRGGSSRTRWPRGLRHVSGAAGLLGLQVRILRGHGWLSLASVVFCQAEVSAMDRSFVKRSPTDMCVCVCVFVCVMECNHVHL